MLCVSFLANEALSWNPGADQRWLATNLVDSTRLAILLRSGFGKPVRNQRKNFEESETAGSMKVRSGSMPLKNSAGRAAGYPTLAS
jgi:hypothetical protein